MKELTYEDWVNNPTPRMMWVWDNDIGNKVKRKVVYITEKYKTSFPVVALNETQSSPCLFMHCAEIKEEPKKRRYTNQELAWWLQDGIKEGKHREWCYRFLDDAIVHSYFDYLEDNANSSLDKDILIREDNGRWREPLVEVEE